MIRVLLATAEPLLGLGIRTILEQAADIVVCGVVPRQAELAAAAAALQPDILVYDVTFQREDPGLLDRIAEAAPGCRAMVIVDHTEEECPLRGSAARSTSFLLTPAALEYAGECCLVALQGAARGCFPRTAPAEQLVENVHAIARGELAIGAWATAHLVTARGGPGQAPRISGREVQVIRLVAEGMSNKQIATRLAIREPTVKNHLQRISRKLHVRSRVELARYALRQGLVRSS